MKLCKLIEQTKLSKKTIYFYISQGLINPTKNSENGYYEFTEEDFNKLNVIICLRKIGMSIQDIKDVFEYPTLTNFFIHRQINNLKQNLSAQIEQLKAGYYLIENIPANAKPYNIELPNNLRYNVAPESNAVIETYFPCVDARMIAILIWAPFMEIESSEYHRFLWDKVANELSVQMDNSLVYLKKLIYCLSPEQIRRTSIFQFENSRKIADAQEPQLKEFEDLLFDICSKLVKNTELQNYWKLTYDNILIPTLSFLNSKTSELLKEYNPRYTRYNKNMHIIARNVYERLNNSPQLLQKIKHCLNNKFNPTNMNYSELICLYTFENSIYTQPKLDTLKKLFH